MVLHGIPAFAGMTISIMSNFFTLKLWFSFYPGPLTPVFLYILIGIIVLFLIAAFITWSYYKKYKKTLYGKLWLSGYNFSLTGLIIGALWLFFTYEQVAFLSARFWFALWFLLHAVWGFIIYKRLKRLPEIKKEIEAKKEFKKYIP